MKLRTWLVAVATAASLAGCSSMPPPVHVIGSAADMGKLAGRWTGEYSGETSQRSGSITFILQADSDTAFGEVVMAPRRQSRGHRPDRTSGDETLAPRSLPISFLMVSGEGVTGVLDPYEDPVSGHVLVTRFWGSVRGEVMSGTYGTTNVRTGEVTYGEWKVKRTSAPEDGSDRESSERAHDRSPISVGVTL